MSNNANSIYNKAITIKELEEIYTYLEKQKCPSCHKEIKIERKSTTRQEDKVYDVFLCKCGDCKHELTYAFDVTEPYNRTSKFF